MSQWGIGLSRVELYKMTEALSDPIARELLADENAWITIEQNNDSGIGRASKLIIRTSLALDAKIHQWDITDYECW
jgi:hypothetical protein